MELTYETLKKIGNPSLYLCNPNQTELHTITPETANVTLRLNDISELSLTVNKFISGNNTHEKVEQPCYALLESKRLIKVDYIGWFEITNVSETENESGSIKTITAHSHQSIYRNKGFYVEDKVYKFYNVEDPYDNNYNASDIGAVPSVCGQLYKQLGIKLNLNETETYPTEDYKDWTLIYIDEKLRFNENNIYRTLKSETTNGYDFMVNTVEKAFEGIWLFDLLTHTIKFKYISSITQPTDIYLSYDNLIQSIEVTENADNIVTVLNCNGGNDLNISAVNPMGTNYVVNFDYYKNTQWMSQELIDVLDQWKENYDSHVEEFTNLVKQLQASYKTITELDAKITYEELKIKDLSDGRDLYITETPIKLETVMVGENSKYQTSPFYSSAFDGGEDYVCYDKPFKYEDETFIAQGDSQEGSLMFRYWDGYYYFTDTNGTTYCKLIHDENDTLGFERYGVYSKEIEEWCNIEEINQVVITCENVGIGDKSLQEGSSYYEKAFEKNSNDVFIIATKVPYAHTVMLPTDETFIGNLDECGRAGFLYFSDGEDDGSYCKINMAAEVDASTQTTTYYASGFTRYTLINQASQWLNRHEQYCSGLKTQQAEQQQTIDDILSQMQAITDVCNVQKYVKSQDSTGELYKELECYWIEGDYSNDTFALTDGMTIAESLDLSKQLKDVGDSQIVRVSQPKFSFNVSSIDFLKVKEFQTFAQQLELGKTVIVEKSSGTLYQPAVTEIAFNLFNADEFTMTFSNSAKLNSNEFTFADLVAESSSVSKSVSSSWQDLISYSKEKETINSIIADPLNRALRAGMGGAVNQEFVIDNTGILGRKYTDSDHTEFLKEQIRIINNMILFTDNNWDTVKTVLGKIYYEDNGEEHSAYGLIAETIIGDLIMGNTLKIKNEGSTVLLDKDGISIKDVNNNVLFNADTGGNVSVTGQINALSGYIGSETAGFLINDKAIISQGFPNYTDSSKTSRVLFSPGALQTDFYPQSDFDNNKASPISIATLSADEKWAIVAGRYFGVTNKGNMYARTGEIGSITLNQYGLRGSDFCLYNNANDNEGGKLGFGTWEGNTITTTTLISNQGIDTKYISAYKIDCLNGWGIFTDNFNCPYYSSSGIPGIRIGLGHIASFANNDLFRIDFPNASQKYAEITGYLIPNFDNNGNKVGFLGASGKPWSGWGSWDNGSDINIKDNIISLTDGRYERFFDNLRPVEYRYKPNCGYDSDYRFGFIAQNIASALETSGLNKDNYAVYVDDGSGILGLKYTEFIALNTNEIQKLKKRVAELESKLQKYEIQEG